MSEREKMLLDALLEAEAGLEFAITGLRGTVMDWPDSSPRKALREVKAAIARARSPEQPVAQGEGTHT